MLLTCASFLRSVSSAIRQLDQPIAAREYNSSQPFNIPWRQPNVFLELVAPQKGVRDDRQWAIYHEAHQ